MTVIDREGMILALALYGTLCVKTFLENQYFDAIIGIGAAARGAISAAIFRKSLKLSPAGRQNNTVICVLYFIFYFFKNLYFIHMLYMHLYINVYEYFQIFDYSRWVRL
jgi:hypothetical protein